MQMSRCSVAGEGSADRNIGEDGKRVTESPTGMTRTPRVVCILLNWNGWRDTIECLESLFRLSYTDFQVVVCDNASSDGSLEMVKGWANGDILAEITNPSLRHLTLPPVPKPIPHLELTREQAESGTAGHDTPLVLIHVGSNLGFAGGNNVGLRFALRNQNCHFFWLINNDTIVDPNALAAQISFMRQRPEVGLCGSLIRSYRNPQEVQSQGGLRYCYWTGRVGMRRLCAPEDFGHRFTSLDFVNGASMLASRAFLEQVGLMEESYFLYLEEPDWAIRAKGKFQLGYSPESVIYHKIGASAGMSLDRMKRSLLSEVYLTRNRVLFTKRFYPYALPTVVLAVCFAIFHRICFGDLKRGAAMFTFMLRGLLRHVPKTAT